MTRKATLQKGSTEAATTPQADSVVLQLPNVVDLFTAPSQTHDIALSDNLAYMRRFPDEFFDLIITSPPYNVGKPYEKRASQEVYIEEQVAAIAEATRLLASRGSICWQVGNYVDDGEIFPLDILLYSRFKDHGLRLRNRIIWTFGHGLHCQKRFSGRHETILWFTKGDDYHFDLDAVRVPSKYPNKKHFKGPNKGELSSNPLGKNPTDVWDIPNVKFNHVEKTDHPCQFPVGLVERLVLALTKPGDRVLDPYLGAGSSAVAALKHGRRAYGCDIMPEYIEIAMRRICELEQGRLRTRPMNKPVYQPPFQGERS
jgi:adenine-specific DNA-methyltransferase